MTHTRSSPRYTSFLCRGLAAFVVLAALSGCEEHTYRVTEATTVYVEENLEALNRLADLISAEPEIREIWCIPPATIEARNRDGGDWFALQGEKYQVYSEQCVIAEIVEGVYMDDDSPVVVLPLIPAGDSALHHELVRPVSEEGRSQTCGPFSLLPFVDHCQIPLEVDGWIVRYRALADEEQERLRQHLQAE